MSIGIKIILMNKGVIQQEATPSVIYHDPDNLFTAQFIGSPQMNVIPFANSNTRYGFRPENHNRLCVVPQAHRARLCIQRYQIKSIQEGGVHPN